MEERNEAISPNDGGACPATTLPRVASGLHSEDSVIEIPESTELQSDAVSESVPNEPEIGQPVNAVNAVITPDGVQELPPWLIGSDGKPLPINERTLRLIRGKTFTVRHDLGICNHQIDRINQPANHCHTCWWAFFQTHETLVQTAHEFYQQFGKERLVALRGRVFVKYFLMFMSTVQHLLEQQKEEQERNASKISESESGGDLREISSVVSDPEEGQR
jgi:hypothetical protein